ncbi:MAG TPA: PilN domain-containing protein, partial [Bacillota bacterium]|nr:PilN domain-containing protein [Bacillota bacterium]
MTLPNLPDSQLENAIRMELDGGGGDEMFHIFSKSAQDTMVSVKVAVVRNKDLTSFISPLRDAGLEVLWLGYHARGIQNFINFHKGFFHDKSRETSYLTFYENRAEFGVVTDETIEYRRDLEANIADFQDTPSQAIEADLIDELRLSAASYQAGQGKQPPKLLWLFGKSKKALTKIQNSLTKAGYQVCVTEKSRLGGNTSGDETPALAALLGLALDELGWDTQEDLRIHTIEQREKQTMKSQLGLAGKFIFAAAVLVSGILLMMQSQLVKREKSNEWLESQSGKIMELKRVEADTGQYLTRIKTMEQWLDLRGRELDFLVALQNGLPEDTLITDFSMEDGKIRNISGVTPSVSLLLGMLQKSPMLRGLKLKGNIAVTEQGLERFQLEGEMKVKETK